MANEAAKKLSYDDLELAYNIVVNMRDSLQVSVNNLIVQLNIAQANIARLEQKTGEVVEFPTLIKES